MAGSGKKLWKQKGTGRARMGSIRSPLWRHGGTVHGPVAARLRYKLPRKMQLGALRSALSAKLRDGELKVVQAFDIADHKTKTLVQALTTSRSAEQGSAGRRAAACRPDELTGAERNLTLASRNLEGVKLVPTREVTVYDLLGHKQVLLSRSGGAQVLGGAGRMNVYEVIRRPIVTEKGVAKKDEAKHAVLRSCSRRQQDPDQGGGREALQGEGGRSADGQQSTASCGGAAASPATVRTGRRRT